jgi:Adenylylsulphate kinase
VTGRLIWITGRAAAGKTTLINTLAERLRQHEIDPAVHSDEQILLQLAADDTGHLHHHHPHNDHRIAFHTGHLFDESLRVLNSHLLAALDHDQTAIVELARGSHHPPIDLTYRHAAHLFDQRLWRHSVVFRLQVDFATQLRRNAHRTTGTGAGTPEEIMARLYRRDDPTGFTAVGIPITTLSAADTPAANATRIISQLRLWPPRGTGRPTDNHQHDGTQHLASGRVDDHNMGHWR